MRSIYKYGNDVTYMLPYLFAKETILFAIQNLLKEYKLEPLKIQIYGNPKMLWGGHNTHMQCSINKNYLQKTLKYVKEYNGMPILTLTSTTLEEKDLKDKYCNMILDTALEMDCSFVVYSDILKNYIKSKDKNAHIIASVIKPIYEFQGANKEETTIENESAYYNKLLEEYDSVVVRPEYAKNVLIHHPELISDISRIKVLINNFCVENCPFALQHYKHLSRIYHEAIYQPFPCYRRSLPKLTQYQKNNSLTSEEINALINIGVRHLGVDGEEMGHEYTAFYRLIITLLNLDGSNNLLLENINVKKMINNEDIMFRNYLQRGDMEEKEINTHEVESKFIEP